MFLHGRAHRIAHLGDALAIFLMLQTRQSRQRAHCGIARQGFGMRIAFQVFDDLPASFTSEHQ